MRSVLVTDIHNIIYGGELRALRSHPKWTIENDFYAVSLKDLDIRASDKHYSPGPFLEMIQLHATDAKRFAVSVADDTNVDFMGFALCLGPIQNLGYIYSVITTDELQIDPNLEPKSWPSELTLVNTAKDGNSCLLALYRVQTV